MLHRQHAERFAQFIPSCRPTGPTCLQSEAGISAFARLLMDAGAWRRVALDGWWDVLCLSTKAPRTLARHWSRLTLSRYTAEHVAVWPDGENDGFMSMSFAGGGPCIARRVVENDALEYWDGVARLLPDYTERGYFELCDTVMHSAKSALTSLLGLACRYQGVLALLLPAPPAAAAGGQE